jgi:hypothetical protein
MATICFRPPPLPPNKKSQLNINRYRKQNNSLLSSTYLSFRDPAEDEIMSVEEIELTNFKCKSGSKKCKKVSHTNSLSRCKDSKATMVRSHSDGNLAKKEAFAPMTINRYIKVLSGSWKNLLSCKFNLFSGGNGFG